MNATVPRPRRNNNFACKSAPREERKQNQFGGMENKNGSALVGLVARLLPVLLLAYSVINFWPSVQGVPVSSKLAAGELMNAANPWKLHQVSERLPSLKDPHIYPDSGYGNKYEDSRYYPEGKPKPKYYYPPSPPPPPPPPPPPTPSPTQQVSPVTPPPLPPTIQPPQVKPPIVIQIEEKHGYEEEQVAPTAPPPTLQPTAYPQYPAHIQPIVVIITKKKKIPPSQTVAPTSIPPPVTPPPTVAPTQVPPPYPSPPLKPPFYPPPQEYQQYPEYIPVDKAPKKKPYPAYEESPEFQPKRSGFDFFPTLGDYEPKDERAPRKKETDMPGYQPKEDEVSESIVDVEPLEDR